MTKRYGLIGCGMMGVEHIQNVNLLDGARVTCVYDTLSDNAAKAANIAGSFEDIITAPDIDAFIIATPNNFHADQLLQIAQTRAAMPVPVLCEKPLFISEEDRGKIQYVQDYYKGPVWVAMEYRYMPAIEAFLKQVDEATGGVSMLTMTEHRMPFLEKFGNWNRYNENSGGTFVEKCCHFFNLMRLIMDAEPVRVMAMAGQDHNHQNETHDGKKPDIWDAGYVLLDFENGKRACLELCMYADGSKWNEEISAVGPEGKLECRIPGPPRFWPDQPPSELISSPRNEKAPETTLFSVPPELAAAGDHHGSTFKQHALFLDVVRGNAAPAVTLEDGIRAVDIGRAAQISAQFGQAVVLGPNSDIRVALSQEAQFHSSLNLK